MDSTGGRPAWPEHVLGGLAANVTIGPVTDPTTAIPGPATGVAGDPGMGSVPGPAPHLVPVRVQCALMLQHLYGWLRAVLPQAPQLGGVIPLLVQAVRLYRAGQDEACLAQIQATLAILHSGWPQFPSGDMG